MSALFACTKCHSRHPFEELSRGEQLCQECRNTYPVVKCTYCRVEFQQGVKGSTNSLCKKCAQNVRTYGKPSACEYCNIIAAFIGNKCQRCANSEKKWGQPQTCEQCKQQCAFDRSEESRRKVDGKLLCWLCTLAYKRVLAKTRKRGIDSLQNTPVSTTNNTSSKGGNSSNGSNNSQQENQQDKSSSRNNHGNSQNEPERNRSSKEKDKDKEKDKKDSSKQNLHKSKSSGDLASDKKSKDARTESSGGSSAKKPRLDKAATNGLAATPAKPASSESSSFMDLSNTDNMIAITQLKEEVEALKKQLQSKDQVILEKDKKLTELKAEHYEAEKNMRTKLTNLTKQHSDQIDNLNTKVRDLQKQLKQVSSLSKSSKKALAGSPS